jgi:hypothetical protein
MGLVSRVYKGKAMTAAIGEIIGNGMLFDVKNWSTTMAGRDDFFQMVEALFETLATRQINYVLVGGVALLSYIEGRNTQDIDLILTRSDLDGLPELVINHENKYFLRGLFEQLQIGILLTENQLFETVLNQFSVDRQFGDLKVRCATVEGLLVLKCYALPSLYRQGDFNRASIYENDILLLLLNYTVDLKPLLKLLSAHLLPSDLQAVEGILQDIQGRIQRFSSQRQSLREGE